MHKHVIIFKNKANCSTEYPAFHIDGEISGKKIIMDIKFIQFQSHGDDRGSLVSLEDHKNIPFTIKRVYYMYDTKDEVRRGFHAHKKLKQLAVVLKGSCRFLLDDGKEKIELLLDNPEQGLYIESFVWREMYDFSEDCVLMVLADSFYDEADYIRDYDSFLKEVAL